MADFFTSNALLDDEKKKQQDQSNGQELGGTVTSGVVSGQGTNSMAQGSTQSKPWTNIQAYLGANQNNDSSAKLLEDNVGSKLTNEQNRFNTESSNATNESKSKADESNWVVGNYDTNFNNAASGNFNNDYSNRAKSLYSTQYNPNQFTYTMDNTTNDYGKNLKDDQSFYNQQNNFYKQAAGGQLSRGQGALQTQLDTNNEKLASTRDKLLKQYSGLSSTIDNGVKSTNDAINSYANTYNTNRANFGNTLSSNNSSLGSDYNNYKDRIDSLENERNSRLNSTEYVTDPNGDMYIPMLQRDRYNAYMDSFINPLKNDQGLVNNKWNYIKGIMGA